MCGLLEHYKETERVNTIAEELTIKTIGYETIIAQIISKDYIVSTIIKKSHNNKGAAIIGEINKLRMWEIANINKEEITAIIIISAITK